MINARRRQRTRRVRDSRKTVPVFGVREDAGRYYRCHWCKFINDTHRDPSFDDMYARHKSEHSMATASGSEGPMRLETTKESFILQEIDAAGDVKPVYMNYVVSSSGCPFCGTTANRKRN